MSTIKSFLTAATAAALMTVATTASALTYNWSFEADAFFSTSPGTVTGTISGLQIGANDGTGLTIEVLSSPSGNVLGGGWVFQDVGVGGGGDAFFIDPSKTVTFADARFIRDGNADDLYFGGFGGYFPQLYSVNEDDGGAGLTNHFTLSQTSFELVSEVPLPAGLPLLLAALGTVGLLARRRRF